MLEVVIKGKFITGIIMDNEEEAKVHCKELLETLLDKARCLKADGLFQFILESVEAERL